MDAKQTGQPRGKARRALRALAAGVALTSASAITCLPAAAQTSAGAETRATTAAPTGEVRQNAAPPPSADQPVSLGEVVVTGTRTPRPRAESPVATEVISTEEIARRGAVNVHEAVRDQLGLESNPMVYDHLGKVGAVQMMGLDGSRVLIMVDGLRVVGDVGGAIDLQRMPADRIERIEIVKGPMSALYGTQALGGVINIVTRREHRLGLHNGGLLEMRTLPAVVAGARRVAADGSYQTSRGGLEVGASTFHVASYDLLPGDASLSTPERREVTGELKGHVSAGGGRLDAGVDVQRSRAVGRVEQTYPGLPAAIVDLPDVFWRVRSRVGFDIERAALGHLQLRIANTYFAGEAAKDRRDSQLDEVRRRWQDLVIGEATLSRAVGQRHQLTAGVQATGEWFQEDLSRVESTGGGISTTDIVEVPRRRLLSEEMFVQDEAQLGPVTIVPGIRALRHHTFGHALAPKLALAWTALPQLRLRAQVGRGLRVPSAQELGFNFDHSFYGYRVVGNPSLRPESSVGVQVGATITLPLGFELTGGAFYNWLSNLIVTELDPAQSTPQLQVFTYQNVGRAHTVGGEGALSWRPTSRVSFGAGYAYVRAVDDVEGGPVPGRAPHTIQASSGWRVPGSETRLDLRGRYRSSMLARRDEVGALHSPGWGTVDLRIAQPIERLIGARREEGQTMEVYAGVENLLDRRRDPLNPADAGPEPGRVIYAGLRGRR